MKHLKKAIHILTGLSLILTLNTSAIHAEEEQIPFDEFLDQLFAEELSSDYLNLHYSYRDYASLGIEKPERIVGEVDMNAYEEDIKALEETIATLKSYDYDSLTTEQQYDYDVLMFSLENEINLNRYPDFDFAFLPSEGILNNLITNYTEFKFYEKEDIQDYLDVLASTPKFVEDALEMTKTQAAKGFFMTDAALDDTIEFTEEFVEKTDDNELIVIFEKQMDAFEGITDAEREDYKKKNRDIVLNHYIPSYEKAITVLESLRGSRKSQGGLSELENGKEYYAALIRMKASCDDSFEELIDQATEYINTQVEKYIENMMSGGDSNGLDDFEIETPEEILAFLQENEKPYFPKGPEVEYKADYLDPSVASDTISAYYLNPPLDDIKDNVIKINGGNMDDTFDLYTTLAHEGFPGHLYQITWYLNQNPAKIRTLLNVIGYTEGWAMYVEMRAVEFSGLSKDAYFEDLLNIQVGYAMNAAVDIGVNGLGWGEKEVADYLSKVGLNPISAGSLVEYVTSNPGTIVPYGIGLVKFENLREQAKEAVKNQFDDTAFHQVLLENGDRPFEIVEKDVQAYIDSIDPSTIEDVPEDGENAPIHVTPSQYRKYNSLLYAGIIIGMIAIGVVIWLGKRKYDKKDLF